MLNIDKVEKVYIACGYKDLRKSIDGLVMIVQNSLKLNLFEKALFVFCNKQMDKIKILNVDEATKELISKGELMENKLIKKMIN
ncbi:IS66 family insertion sequence element accessory protein TnpB [Clostridium sp. Sa3CUN1]|uniref:IS66 family insertion sequence element accessory protein TnpB n=1 Tax=Clostridium gallinarum TaxID=2762246 RepID=A0ABR8Q6T4_9CLOT|nr:IS66 family insertion sequence element accessory protein TnpB [Clostridium gallinarum]MBD7916147.1 IS66 family insertion sequence element accessory protein TnpB [Clostridium gallinarum]